MYAIEYQANAPTSRNTCNPTCEKLYNIYSQGRIWVDDEALILHPVCLGPLNDFVSVPAHMGMTKPVRPARVVEHGPPFERHVGVAEDGLPQVVETMLGMNRVMALFDLVLVSRRAVAHDAVVGVQHVVEAVDLVRPGHFPQRVAVGIEEGLAELRVALVIGDVDIASALWVWVSEKFQVF